jgi:hypothetical protein
LHEHRRLQNGFWLHVLREYKGTGHVRRRFQFVFLFEQRLARILASKELRSRSEYIMVVVHSRWAFVVD